MSHLTSIILLCLLTGFGKADFCQDNFTISELPGGIMKEVLSILLTGTINDFLGCDENISVPDDYVKLWLYTRNNSDVPVLLDPKNPYQLDPSKPIKLLVPGWLCNVTNDRMPQLANAYLQRYDCNVIGIDWTKLSIDLYTSSFCGVPGVAQILGDFLCNLNTQLNVNLDQVHLVGHSMGGQLSGYVGQEVQRRCQKKLGRITGLDPAGPLYQGLPASRRLDESDASFVDVIHTNQGFLGYYGPCGSVDFFPNCGTFQPGCLKVDGSTSIRDIINLPTAVVGCNHLRSSDYMVESINSNDFVATSCKTCPGMPVVGPCLQDILFPSRIVMGETCPSNPPDRKYKLHTNSEPPYGQGRYMDKY